ncbi:MAG: rhodanese-like domain-containing protein [Phaeodactylibacter sp.]|uniref:rhodanese-like domain-containing protein n=1 Tax=Phaeodactylibacter sp. TaxID=1940289 RepID=UPI0032EFF664
MAPYRSLPVDLFMVELALTADAVLIDLRTPREIRKDKLMDHALNLDYLSDDFDESIREMDRLRPYFLYDDGGKRAPLAASLMARLGFRQVAYLVGGRKEIQDFE